jgi:hypothetical protein
MSTAPGKDGDARNARMMGRITAVLTALVAFNTLVFSCSNDHQARETAAVARNEAVERFWTDAMRDLDALIKDKPGVMNQSVETKNWLSRCRLLSQRTLKIYAASDAIKGETANAQPDMVEEEFARAEDVRKRAAKMQNFFLDDMQRDDVVGPECASIFAQEQEMRNEIVQVAKEESKGPSAPFKAADDPATAAAFLQRNPSVTLNREAVNVKGFDVDLFWCDRDGNPGAVQSNITDAVRLGRVLANIADANGRLQGQSLGRIQLRRLSTATQGLQHGTRYPRIGAEIRFDQHDAVEQALAQEIIKAADLSDLQSRPQGKASPWYVSGFFCRAGQTLID